MHLYGTGITFRSLFLFYKLLLFYARWFAKTNICYFIGKMSVKLLRCILTTEK